MQNRIKKNNCWNQIIFKKLHIYNNKDNKRRRMMKIWRKSDTNDCKTNTLDKFYAKQNQIE